MEKKSWTQEEKQRPRELRLDPAQNKPEKLIHLVTHFRSGGSKFAVTEGGGPVRTSKGLVTKVQGLVDDGSLDWLVDPPRDDSPLGKEMEAQPPLGIRVGPSVGGPTKPPDENSGVLPSPGESAHSDGPESRNGECATPAPWPGGVAQLESWGISKANAPDYLKAWKQTHEKGWHGVCGWYVELVKNLGEGVPFPDVYHVTYANWLGKRWNAQFLIDIADLLKLHQPWQGGANRRVFKEEIQKVLSYRPTDPEANPTEASPEHAVDLLGATAHEMCQLAQYGEEIIKRYSRRNLNLRAPDPGPPVGLTPDGSRDKLVENLAAHNRRQQQNRRPPNPAGIHLRLVVGSGHPHTPALRDSLFPRPKS